MKEKIISKRGYVVTEDGQLINPKGEKIGCVTETYQKFTVKINDKKVSCYTHRLQAYQKYGDKLFDEGIIVRHHNGNSLDNSWNNILIGTHSDNMMDIPEQIRIKKANIATSHVRKYNKEEVKSYYNNCKSYKKTMENFNISSKGTLSYILNN